MLVLLFLSALVLAAWFLGYHAGRQHERRRAGPRGFDVLPQPHPPRHPLPPGGVVPRDRGSVGTVASGQDADVPPSPRPADTR